MKQGSIYLLIVCLLFALAACSDVTEIGGIDNDHAGVSLEEGEQEVHLYLKGLGNGGGVPVTRASGPVTLPGESMVDEIVVYCFVNLNQSGTSVEISNYGTEDGGVSTLERVYHYKSGTSGNDLVLASDGDGYRISLGVLRDDKLRYFVIHANAGAVPAQIVAYGGWVPAATTHILTAVPVSGADRSSATVSSALRNAALPFPLTYTTPSSVASPVLPPLPMRGTGYRTEALTGGHTCEVNWLTADELAKGVSFNLSRGVARFDIGNSVATGFTVSGIAATGVRVNFWDTDTFSIENRALDNAELIAGAFYLPRTIDTRDANWGADLEIQVSGTLYGVPTTVKVKPDQNMIIAPNTRYIINILNSGSTLSATLRVAEWKDGDSEIEGGDLLGTLNEEATVEIHEENKRSASLNFSGMAGNKISLMWGWLSSWNVSVTLTGKSGTTKPVGMVLPQGVFNEESIFSATNAEGKHVTYLPVINHSNPLYEPVPVFTPPQTSVLKVITHPVGADGKAYEKCDEYEIERDWIIPAMIESASVDIFPPINIVAPSDKWTVNTTNKVITLPVLTEYGALKLQCSELGNVYAGKESGWITEGLGDWLKTSYTMGQEVPSGKNIMPFIEITPMDNFKSGKERVSELVLREYKETALVYTTYKIIQPGGNCNAALLSEAGFGVNISQTFNGGSPAGGLEYNSSDKSLNCPSADLAANPIAYNICIHSNDSNPIFVEIIQGGSWMTLEQKIARTDGSTNGLYTVGLRISDNKTGVARSGKIAVSYQDAASGSLKTEIVTINQAQTAAENPSGPGGGIRD